MGVEKEQINLEVTINGKKAGKSLGDLSKESRALNASINKLKPGTKEFVAASKKLRDVKTRMRSVRDEINGTGGALSKIKKQLGPVGGLFAGAFAVGKLISFGQELIGLSDIQTKAEKQLEVSLGGVSKKLLEQASALQKVTEFGDEQVIQGQALLAAFTDNEDEIAALTPAILDMAQAFGMDLNSAFSLVGKTLGSSTNAMSRYGIEVVGAVGSNERLTSIVGALEEKFKGQAEAALAGAGGFKQFDNLVGDLKENMGALLIKGLNPMIKGFGQMVISATKFLSVPLSEEIEQERQDLNLLVMQITDANLVQEDRNKLIEDLQKTYPDFLKNLDAETVTNEELAGRLRDVNEQLVNKVIIQRKEEELADQAEDTADALEDRLNQETRLRKKLIKTNEEFALGVDFTNKTLEEQADIIKDRLAPLIKVVATSRKEGTTLLNKEGIANSKINQILSLRAIAQKNLNEEQAEANEILKEKNDLLDLLGITEGAEDPEGEGGDGGDGGDEETTAAKKAREKREKEAEVVIQQMLALQARVDAIKEQQRIKQLEENEQELEQIRVSFDAKILQAAGFEEQQDQLKIIRDEALRLKREEQALAEIEEKTAFMDQILTIQLSADEQEVKAVNDKYAILISQAEQFGLDSASLKQLQNQEITALIMEQNKKEELLDEERNSKALEERAKRNAAEKAMMNDVSSAFGSALSLMARDEEEFAEFSKIATLFQLALDTAAAIGSLTSASSANPSNAITFGAAGAAQFIAGLAQILGNVSRAKRILSSKRKPRAFAEGGGTPGRSTLIEVGEVGTEWISPNWMLKSPLYADTIGMLEHARVNKIGKYQEGGPVGGIPSTAGDPGISLVNESSQNTQRDLTAAVNRLSDRLDNPVPSRAFFTPTEVKDIQLFTEELEEVRDQSNIV